MPRKHCQADQTPPNTAVMYQAIAVTIKVKQQCNREKGNFTLILALITYIKI